MTKPLLPLSLLSIFHALALYAQDVRGLAPRLDTIFYTDGSKRAAKVLSVDAEILRIELPSPQPNQKPIFVTEPRRRVARIEFAPNEALENLLNHATPAQVAVVEVAWLRAEPFLGLPKSPAARVGNAYGDLLLRSGGSANHLKALALFARIEKEAWDEAQRAEAAKGRLRGMIATGRAVEAVREAKALAVNAHSPAIVIDARFILAEAAASDLRELIDENPRWQEDPRIQPERDRLYNAAIDDYLYPFLFFGSETQAAARGLNGAMDVYLAAGEAESARSIAQDIIEIYPQSPYAARARALLASDSPK